MEGRKEFWPGADPAFHVGLAWDRLRGARRPPEVVRISEIGCSIRFPGSDAPVLVEGREIRVTIALKNARAEIERDAAVLNGVELEGWRVFQLRFLQPESEREHLRRLLERHFNRRRAYRVAPDPTLPLSAEIGLPDVPWLAGARVRDISATGISLLVGEDVEDGTLDDDTAVVRLRRGEEGDSLSIPVSIVGRERVDGGVLFRLCFLDDGTSEFRQAIEEIVHYVMACQLARLQSK